MVMPLIQGREEDRHFLNNCAWQHTRVTGAERKEATSDTVAYVMVAM